MMANSPNEAVVISDVYGTRAGAYLATLLLCRALAGMGLKVTCFATWADPREMGDGRSATIRTPLLTKGSRWDWPSRCLAWQAAEYIHKRKPSLSIVVGLTRLSRYLLKSHVAKELLIWELTNANPGNKFVDVTASKLLTRSMAVLSPSTTIDRNIRKTYGYDGTVKRLPFWIEEEGVVTPEDHEGALADFIYLGRRDEEKGLRELIQATHVITVKYPNVRVVVGGVGDETAFASLAKDLGLENNIIFRTFPTREQVGEALANSRCLVLPSYHEGYPLVLLEAARAGVPFIATDVGSVREVFGESDACIIVEPRDTESLAQGMRKILSESAVVYRTRGKAAREIFSEVSSHDKVMENLKSVLQFTLSR